VKRHLLGAILTSAGLAAGLVATAAGPATGAGVKPNVTTTLYVAPATGRSTLPAGCPSAPFSDINAAIAAATPNDTVVVCPGTYTGYLTITTSSKVQSTISTGVEINKSIAVIGMHGAVISAAGLDNGVTFYDANGAELKGFTVTGATGEGILAVVSTRIEIDDNVVRGNDAGTATSGYAECRSATGSLGNCGYGIHLLSVTRSDLLNNTVEYNSGGVILTDEYGPARGNTIEGNLVENNGARSGICLVGVSTMGVNASGAPTPKLGGVYSNTLRDNVVISNGTSGYPTSTGATGYGGGVVLTTDVKGGAAYDNRVMGNEIVGNGLNGVRVVKQVPLSDVSGDLIANNWIGTNNVSAAPTSGVLIGRDSAALSPVAVTVYDNTIAFNYVGILDNAGPGLTRSGNHYLKDVVDVEQ
jgi:parallel beta-helix repeat protein